ncbi:hypothetical protein M0R88_05355 [Halorussus gelatinilyticus]|uniref:Uncharacterized protein n=1 Tax=Halorussus gelatinilyticus TaxID=2937524 RepID=A0A8U0ILP8_9EURY|nr:hypothetical protein [Halorussus gelatinilyticus]UPW01531.1 hypothetical protein M0R88_05355 [Halorussus gelatinilyticus]
MPRFDYPCPDCRTTSNLHGPDCEYEGASWSDIEKAYTDLVAVLSANALPEEALREAVHGRWSSLHKAALDRLVHEQRVMENEEGHLKLLTAEQYKEHVTDPNVEPIKTVARKGSVPGAHDNAVFAMIAWYEMVGLSWNETRERVVDWLRDTGTWTRGGFEEASPQELVNKKRHVYESGYGWKEKAEAAKAVIDRSL